MISLIFEALAWGLAAGIVGAVYREIIADEEFFNPWWQFGQRFENKWFFKPVWGCAHCFAGQVAWWTYIYLKIVPAAARHRLFSRFFDQWAKYTFWALCLLFCLIIATAAAIFVAKILAWFIQNKIK